MKMDVLTFETCRAVNSEIIKQVTSSWSIFIQLREILYMFKEFSISAGSPGMWKETRSSQLLSL